MLLTVPRRRCTSPPEVGAAGLGVRGAHGEAAELVTRQGDPWKNVGKRFIVVSRRNGKGRVSRVRIG